MTRPSTRRRSSLETSVPALVLLGAVGLFFCFTPGLDAPNYHGAFVLALLGGVVGGLGGVFAGHRAATDVRPPGRAALRRLLWPALLPLGLLLVNGLQVRQCDVGLGIAFYAIGPLFTILWSACLGGWLGAAIFSRLRASLAFVAIWLLWVGLDVAHILTEPAIFAFNPFGGYFAGNLYDTSVPLDLRYLAYRAANLMQLGLFGAVFHAGWDADAARWSWRRLLAAHPLPQLAVLLSGVGVLAFWQARDSLGHVLDAGAIERTLGGRLTSERLTLVWDRARMTEAEAEALLEDHLYRLHQLEEALGEPYPHHITSYIYGDEDEKRRLMGAGRVYLAKPWQRAIHLNRVAYGAPVVMHELAHVVLGMDAPSPLHIPTRLCVIPQMGLIEGAAEAFEWDTGPLTPHQWTAALRQIELAPPLDRLLAPTGFYLQSSSVAYTMAGSFIRWLIDTRGIAPFRRLYGDGDFEAAYGAPVGDLVAAWEDFIDAQSVSEEAALVATARFRTRAIFFQVCGLDVARKEAEAWRAWRKGDRAAAEKAWAQVIRWVPENPDKRLPLIDLALRDGALDTLRARATSYFSLKGRAGLVDARVVETLADGHLKAGDGMTASWLYPFAAAWPASDDRLRNLAVKLAVALASGDAGSPRAGLAAALFSGDTEALERAGDDPLGIYLSGRRAASRRQFGEAIAALERVLGALGEEVGEAPRLHWEGPVRLESLRLLAESLYFDGALERAEATFERLMALSPHDGDRARYADWIARIAWRRARPVF